MPFEHPENKPNLRRRLEHWWLEKRCPTEFLCDNCRYDHGSVCKRPERPNATRCHDYRPR